MSGTGNTGGIYRRYASVRTVLNTPFFVVQNPLDFQLKGVKNKNGVSLNLKKDNSLHFLGWFLRESDSELQIWPFRKNKSFVQNETGVMCEIGCGDGTRVICLFARVIQQFGFWT